MNTLLWLPLITLVAALVLTGLVRRYALARNLLDLPGERSSHTLPTPRGGGIAIVASFAASLGALHWLGLLEPTLTIALAGSGLAVALIGFADDHRPLAARWRLLVHFSAVLWALYWLGGAPTLTVSGFTLGPGLIGGTLITLYLVWLLNLYNFMDGIDGLAGVEAVCAGVGGSVLFALTGQAGAALAALCIAAAAAGFLAWNLPPARIFMGDVGSGFLGVVFGVLSLHAAHLDPQLLWAWPILLGAFVVDASCTLLRRLLRGEAVHLAHRSHAYQHAARHFGSHLPVTAGVAAINLLWLAPLAVVVALGKIDSTAGLMLAYAPLLLLAWRFNAGAP